MILLKVTKTSSAMSRPLSRSVLQAIALAKRLKKEKVNVDVVTFGDEDQNLDILKKFIDTLNGAEGTG